MSLLDLYIGRTILQQALLVMAVLVGLFTFVIFMDQIADIGSRNFGVVDALRFVALSVPRIIYEVFPMAALLGSILGLSSMALDSELIVIRTSGVSLTRLTTSVLKMGGLFVLVSILIGELVSPHTEKLAQRSRAEALQRNIDQGSSFGLWMRDQNTYVNIGEVLNGPQENPDDLSLLRVKVFRFEGHDRLHSLIEASTARYIQGTWEMRRVTTTTLGPEGFAEVINRDVVAWDTSLTPDMLTVFVVQPDQLSMSQLRRYISHLERNSQDTRAYELAYWGKWMLPLSTAVMVVLAIPFVFGSIRSGSMGRNLFLGSLIGLGFYFLSRAFGYVVLVHGVPPLVGAALPSMVFLLVAALLYRRVM